MERETGFEPATSTLARSHSTTELLPLTQTTKIAYHADWVPSSEAEFSRDRRELLIKGDQRHTKGVRYPQIAASNPDSSVWTAN